MDNEKYIKCYGGYIDDQNELKESASGGIATSLSKFIINNKGIVAGVAYTKDFKGAEYILVDNLNDLAKLKSSKYINVQNNNIFTKIKSLLEEKKHILFFGTPCMVAAIKSFLKIEYENLYTVSLICHGPIPTKIHTQYIEKLEKKYKSKIIDFNVRKKQKNYLPSYIYAKFENNKIFQDELYNTEYGYAFATTALKQCFNCKFKNNIQNSDIIIGDYQGVSKNDEFFNKLGTSVIITYTKKGDDLVNSLNDFKLFPGNFDYIIKRNYSLVKSRTMNKKVEDFNKDIDEKGLFYAVNKSRSLNEKLKSLILRNMPLWLKIKLRDK